MVSHTLRSVIASASDLTHSIHSNCTREKVTSDSIFCMPSNTSTYFRSRICRKYRKTLNAVLYTTLKHSTINRQDHGFDLPNSASDVNVVSRRYIRTLQKESEALVIDATLFYIFFIPRSAHARETSFGTIEWFSGRRVHNHSSRNTLQNIGRQKQYRWLYKGISYSKPPPVRQ